MTQIVLTSAAHRNPHCTCEELGLRAGITVFELRRIEGCCAPRYVCPVLDNIRRQMGV